MGTGRSDFMTVQVDRCPFHVLGASDSFLRCKMHYIFFSFYNGVSDKSSSLGQFGGLRIEAVSMMGVGRMTKFGSEDEGED